jgi:hypothetical protein
MTEPPSPLRMLLSRHTKRREFITVVGGGAAVWPFAVRAQQSKGPTIGVLVVGVPGSETSPRGVSHNWRCSIEYRPFARFALSQVKAG